LGGAGPQCKRLALAVGVLFRPHQGVQPSARQCTIGRYDGPAGGCLLGPPWARAQCVFPRTTL